MSNTCPVTSAAVSSVSVGQNSFQKSHGAVVKSQRVSSSRATAQWLELPVGDVGSNPISPIKNRLFDIV